MVSDIRSGRAAPTTAASTTTAIAGSAPPADDAAAAEALPDDDRAGRFVPGTARVTVLAPLTVAPRPTLHELAPGLKKGDVGPQVSTLQQTLTERGYPASSSGVLDAQTEKRLKAFQQEHGLAPTGVADDVTLAALAREPGAALAQAHAAASPRGAALADAADERAKATDTIGACALSVRHALENAGLTPHARGDAYEYGERLRQRADMQEIVGLSVSDLDGLPPGTVIVYGRSDTKPHGHVTVVSNDVNDDGERLESSDHQQDVARIANSPSYGTDFGAGATNGPRYRVFVPLPVQSAEQQ